ncbi:Alpha/beta hydrolase fold-1 [Kockovaella imperatae]|uniref:Alpha/beta hydrolase fold-1 n=1 Tax=Kockovaella imperatae TaxID=4999 RepID=A0A1Y1UMI5_9TREE|nr:Alpha/beta hydrolase fold-1 [Kockovaella imperatae]ORX38704.1 Alpha/beta hydrolase fold-1 [Kockovaella imperatae]
MLSKPTILVIHGSWHVPAHYEPLVQSFKSQGFEAVCPRLPSFAAKPHIGLREDVRAIQAALEELVEAGQDILVLAHSYGGVVTSQAVTREYDVQTRMVKGLKGGVVGLVFMATFLPLPGESLADALGSSLPPFLPIHPDGSCTMLDPAQAFYHDVPSDQAQHWISLLKPCPAITQFSAITDASYLSYRSTYIYATDDQRLPYPIQKWMVKRASLLGARFNEKEVKSSHSPFLSMPKKIVECVQAEIDNGVYAVDPAFVDAAEAVRREFGEILAKMGPPPS